MCSLICCRLPVASMSCNLPAAFMTDINVGGHERARHAPANVKIYGGMQNRRAVPTCLKVFNQEQGVLLPTGLLLALAPLPCIVAYPPAPQ